MKGTVIVATFVLLLFGSLAGAFFYHDSIEMREVLKEDIKKIASLNATISDLELSLGRLRKEAKETELKVGAFADQAAEIERVQNRVEIKDLALAEVQRELQDCRDSNAFVQTLREADRGRLQELEGKTEILQEQLLGLEEMIEQKNAAAASLKKMLADLGSEKNREKEESLRKIEESRNALEKLRLQLNAAETQAQDHLDRNVALNASVQEVEVRLRDAEKEAQTCSERLAETRNDLAANEIQISYLLQEVRRVEDEAALRNSQLKKLIREKEGRLEQAMGQILTLRSRIDENESTRVLLETRFSQLRDRCDFENLDAKEKIGRLETSVAETEAQLNASRREGTDFKERFEKAASDADAMKSEISELHRKIEDSKNLHRLLESELASIQAQQSEQEDERRKILSRELAEKTAQLNAAEGRLGSVVKQLEQERARIVTLSGHANALENLLQKEQREAAQRNDQLKSLIKEKEVQLQQAAAYILSMREAFDVDFQAHPAPLGEKVEPQGVPSGEINRLLTQLDEKIQEKNRELQNTLEEVDKWKKLYEELEGSLELTKDQVQTLEKLVFKTRTEKGKMEYQLRELDETYKSLIGELHENLESKDATITEYKKQLTVTFVDKILFGRAAAEITPGGQKVLRQAGEVFKRRQGKIRIIGHTDSDPISSKYRKYYPSNWELSGARAASVARFFQDEIGIAPERIEITGRAFIEPVAGNDTEEGKAKNRRVEIVVAPNSRLE